MIKRILPLLLAVTLLLSGCTDWLGSGETRPTGSPTGAPTADYTAEYANRWCYRALTPRMRQMYAAVYAAVKECDTDTPLTIHSGDGEATDYIGLKVTLPVPLNNSEEARLLFTAITTDHPQFFFLGNTYSYEGYRVDGVDHYDVFCLTLTMDAAAREAAYTRLEREVTGLLATLPLDADQYETERLLHDKLLARVTYDEETAEANAPAQRRPTAFSAYGALVEGSAVCEGYSRALQLLLQRAGVPCTLVSGRADGEAHMWNLVEIDGRGYHLDPTWNDAEDLPQHTYFNLTTEELTRTHALDGDNLNVGTCTATEANFYRREGRFLDTFDREVIAEAVATQVLTGAEVVELRFTEDTFPNAQLFFSSTRRVRQYTAPFLGEQTMWAYTCRYNAALHTLTLYKKE